MMDDEQIAEVKTLGDLYELTLMALDMEFTLGGMTVDEVSADVEAAVVRLGRTLLDDLEYRRARVLLMRGLARFPRSYDIMLCLGEVELDDAQLQDALRYFERAERVRQDDPAIYKFLAITYERLERYEDADSAWRKGFPQGTFVSEDKGGDAGRPSLLAIMTPQWGNIRFRRFAHNSDFRITRCFAESYDDASALEHFDLVFNAIGDPSYCGRALDKAERIVERLQVPVVNEPRRVLHTGREEIAQTMQGIPGVIVPRIRRFSTAELEAADGEETLGREGFTFPLLLRLAGYHSGLKFEKIDSAGALPAYLDNVSGGECLVIQFIDARLSDGFYRKYRVMSIAGILYPLHLAISRDWKVHYVTSDMQRHAEFRQEEERFLDHMSDVLGSAVLSALQKIFDRLGLDYAGADFAVTPGGEIVLFEANPGMAIVEAQPDPMWNYRRPAVDRVINAAQEMLLRKVKQPG